jgi:hypothetical protein
MLIEAIREAAKGTPVYHIVKRIKEARKLRDWKTGGRHVPPPHIVKQRVVKEYAKMFSIDILVEAGTYQGDMVQACKDTFRRILSIELDEELYTRAKNRFSELRHISIIQGDSGEVLRGILSQMEAPCLFWLDSHYSGGITARGKRETPIRGELGCILDHSVSGHVILIDDARLFVGKNDYPTIEELRSEVLDRHPDWVFEVKDDILRIHK